MHSPLYAVIRKMSMYTECDLIIGIFLDEKSAITGINDYKLHLIEKGDTHANQGYMTVNLEHDIVIENLFQDEVCDTKYESGQTIFLELSVLDGFGQTVHGIAYVTPNITDLVQRNENRVEEDNMYESYDKIVIGSIRYNNKCSSNLFKI